MSIRVHSIALTILLAGFAPSARAATAQNGINLNGINLNGINLNGINLNGINLNGINLNGINLNGLSPNGINLNGINLNGINLNGINLNGINLNGINLNGINLNGINLNGLSPNGINLNGINLNGINLNGINLNGINLNGINLNGINLNGINLNGFGGNGLADVGFASTGVASPSFESWFARDPAFGDMLMKYVAQCALPAGDSRSFTQAGRTYSWSGVFGLAPEWSAGAAIPTAEQELVSACIAAHANAQGKHVQISVRGFRADGSAIPVTREESAGFTFREASYFGNLFDGSGIFVALERDVIDPAVSTPRGCAAERGVPGSCGPMVQAGMAADRCEVGGDGATYGACSVNGRSFRPLQVFLSTSDVTRVVD